LAIKLKKMFTFLLFFKGHGVTKSDPSASTQAKKFCFCNDRGDVATSLTLVVEVIICLLGGDVGLKF